MLEKVLAVVEKKGAALRTRCPLIHTHIFTNVLERFEYMREVPGVLRNAAATDEKTHLQ